MSGPATQEPVDAVWVYDRQARKALASAVAAIDGLAEQVHERDRPQIKELADQLWDAFQMGRKTRSMQ